MSEERAKPTINNTSLLESKCIYNEVDAMIELSSLIYGMATLAHEVKEKNNSKNVKDPEFLEELPRTSHEVVSWAKDNYDILKSDSDQEEYDIQALDEIIRRDEKNQLAGHATLEEFDVERAFMGKDSEIVYAITKNPDLKRLTVVFRGSSTPRDWFQNIKSSGNEVEIDPEVLMKVIPNPNVKALKDFDKVQVHTGFFEYLFVDKKDGETTKFTKIVNKIKELFEDDYTICFTGHSLGGALATIAGTAFAVSDDFKSVKVISVAAPHIGRSAFARAFETLEEHGRIQHLRVTNDNDLVPQLLNLLNYKHTGIHLNLVQKGWISSTTYHLSPTANGICFMFTDNMRMSWKWLFGAFLKYHKLSHHSERLEQVSAKADLQKITIDGAYEKYREIDPSLFKK